MNEADVLDEDRSSLLDAFAASPPREDRQVSIIPATAFPSAPQSVGAQPVAVRRDDKEVLQRLKVVASAAGGEFFYRFPVKNRKENRTDWIEGPSIKLANELSRIYGNCSVDTRVMDIGDSWIIYAEFIDYETGFRMVRPFQQRKSQRGMRTDDARGLDIALQIGVSKAIRNVVVNSLQTYADFTFEEARSALVDKIGTDLPSWRTRTIEGLARRDIALPRVEAIIGRAAKDWLAPDVARIIAMMKAIADGMATADETFPPLDAKPEGDGGAQTNNESPQGSAGAAATSAADQPDSAPSQQPPSQGSSAAAAAGQESGKAAGDGKPEGGKSEAKPEAKNTQKEPPKEKPADEKPPANEKDYVAYATAWREAATDPVAAMARWKAEKDLRNKCNVGPDTRDDLLAKLQTKCGALQKAEG